MQFLPSFVLLAALFLISTRVHAQEKLPVPSKADQETTEKLIKELHKSDYAKSKTPADRVLLAQKLLKQGIDTNDNPTGRFVLFQQARELAVSVGSVGTIFNSVEQMNKTFEVSETLLIDSLVEASKLVKPVKPSMDDLKRIMQIVEDAVDNDDFELSSKYLPIASFVGRNLGPDSSKAVSIRSMEIEQLRKAYPAVKDARLKLEGTPDDAEACLTIGNYECFLKGEWNSGLKFLAKCSDPALRSLAERDLANSMDAKMWVALGDDWWQLTETSSGQRRANVAMRADGWYQKARSSATGLTATKIDQRIKETQTFTSGTSLSSGIAVPQKKESKLSVSSEPSPITPGHSFELVIRVRVPASLKTYKAADLSGTLIGSDKYKQVLRFAKESDVPVNDGVATVRLRIPGADPGVSNTVYIESKMLRERVSADLK